jgi:hypothetical protein
MAKTVEVVIPEVLPSVTVCEPGAAICAVVVVLTVETGQEVPDPVKVIGVPPRLLVMLLIVPAEIVLPEVVLMR